MAKNAVQFNKCTSQEWGTFTPDNYSFYYITDTKDIYLGNTKLNNEITASTESIDFKTIIGNIPFYYDREYLFTPTQNSIIIHANTQININNKGYILSIEKELSAISISEAGKDIYIYACEPTAGNDPIFILSKNSTVPDGYNADNSRKIGGFHCLCADVGEIQDHPLSEYKAGDILPASVWDLKHRPAANPEGMVYDSGTNKWYDIYLSSWNGSELVSEYNSIITTGVTFYPCHGYKFRELLGQIGKRLLWRYEFMCVAKGSNENTSIDTGLNAILTGGHVDNAGRRMVSNIGLEDCCGALYQWVNDEYEDYSSGISNEDYLHAYWDKEDQYSFFSEYEWNGNIANYNRAIDSQTYGHTYGYPRQGLVGGNGHAIDHSGSRCLCTSDFGSCVSANFGARGVSESLKQ